MLGVAMSSFLNPLEPVAESAFEVSVKSAETEKCLSVITRIAVTILGRKICLQLGTVLRDSVPATGWTVCKKK